jgi:hypothetical protein
MWTDLDVNPLLLTERVAINRLRHDTAEAVRTSKSVVAIYKTV